eukprot:scaffold18649_cov71-Phaeocystis_antarctica.AAC.6
MTSPIGIAIPRDSAATKAHLMPNWSAGRGGRSDKRRQADIVEERVPLRNRLALALAHQHPQVPDAGSSTQALDVALRLELIDVHNHAAAGVQGLVSTQRKELTRRA